jgi:hypothetical protein
MTHQALNELWLNHRRFMQSSPSYRWLTLGAKVWHRQQGEWIYFGVAVNKVGSPLFVFKQTGLDSYKTVNPFTSGGFQWLSLLSDNPFFEQAKKLTVSTAA